MRPYYLLKIFLYLSTGCVVFAVLHFILSDSVVFDDPAEEEYFRKRLMDVQVRTVSFWTLDVVPCGSSKQFYFW